MMNINEEARKYFEIGGIFYIQKNYEESLNCYTKAIELASRYRDAYYARGTVYNKLGKYEETIKNYTKAIEIDSRYKEVYNDRGYIYTILKRYKEALEDFNEAIKIDPNYKEAYNNRGVLYDNLNKYKEALEDYTKIIEIDPNYKEAYNNRGIIYNIIEEYTKAIKDFSKAIEIDPSYKEAYYNRGDIYSNLRKYAEALNDYDIAIKIDPNYKEAYNNRAAVYNKVKLYKLALNDYIKAIEIDPIFKEAYNGRGNVYSNLGKYTEALNDYNIAIKIDSDFKEAYFNRGITYDKMCRYEEAIKNYNKVIEIDYNYISAYNNRGITYDKICRYEEAIKDYNKVIERNPNFEGAYFNKGMTYIKCKNPIEVKENFKKFLEIQKQENKHNIEKIIDDKINGVNKINIEDDILSLIKSILFNNSIEDDEKLKLIDLICFCYQLMEEIKIKSSEINKKNFVHYTKANSLQFLLKKDYTAKLRLNNAVYMNDPEEGQILKQIIHKLDENNDLVNLFEDNDDIKNYTYLTCFSPDDKKDELPMWVHYGDNGKGVGLVFNKEFFDKIDLYKVQYIDIKNFDISKLNENISDNIKAIFDFLEEDEIKNNNNREFKTYVNIILNYISYLFKDKAYEYENEVRILNYRDYNSSDIKTVISESGIPKLYIDYNKCISNKNCVEVIAGPKANYTEISAYSKYVGISKVSKSEIKYR